MNPTVLEADERKVHEFVTRRFLACCSQDAIGSRSEVEILYGGESFRASGLAVIARNYLEVYPYENWTSTEQLPEFRVGEVFEPKEANLVEGKTSKPGYLTEPELIALMDANGIGTDATMAEHIKTIQDRCYAETRVAGRTGTAGVQGGSDNDEPAAPPTRGRGRGRGRGARSARGGRGDTARSSGGPAEFIPTTLGVALYEGYEKMGLEHSLTKPFLRKEMEIKMKAICDGQMTRAQVVNESIDMYRDVYKRTFRRLDVLKTAVRKYVHGEGGQGGR